MNELTIEKTVCLIQEGKYYDAIDMIIQSIQLDGGNRRLEWFSTRSPEEYNLFSKACDHEQQYFTDLTMQDYEEELTAQTDEETGIEYKVDVLGEGYQGINGWLFKISKLEDCDGLCNYPERTIYINAESNGKDFTLLHEMIHAYIYMLPEFYKQFLLFRLYSKLQSQIPQLLELLTVDIHTLLQHDGKNGHCMLFVLKSLDLDLKLKKPLGTVYSYGREEVFKDYDPLKSFR